MVKKLKEYDYIMIIMGILFLLFAHIYSFVYLNLWFMWLYLISGIVFIFLGCY